MCKTNTEDGPKKIDSIKFLDLDVDIYYDKYSMEDSFMSSWQSRNPDSFYKGIMYMNNKTGKITYPEGAVIPEYTAKDREMIPKFLLCGTETVTDEIKQKLYDRLVTEHKRRNEYHWKELNY